MKFTPTAWAKMLFLRDYGDTEVGGFGITPLETTETGDLLVVEDVKLVKQECSMATVEFDDESVADFFEDMVDEGRKPDQFGRIWIHTHPGNSASPSGVDEATFSRVFGGADWALMFILACGGETYARLRLNKGPQTVDVKIAVEIDWSRDFDSSDQETWEDEYLENVTEERYASYGYPSSSYPGYGGGTSYGGTQTWDKKAQTWVPKAQHVLDEKNREAERKNKQTLVFDDDEEEAETDVETFSLTDHKGDTETICDVDDADMEIPPQPPVDATDEEWRAWFDKWGDYCEENPIEEKSLGDNYDRFDYLD